MVGTYALLTVIIIIIICYAFSHLDSKCLEVRVMSNTFHDHHGTRNSTTVLPSGNMKSSTSMFSRIFLKSIPNLEVGTLIPRPILHFCFPPIASCFPRDFDRSVLDPSQLLKRVLCKLLPFSLEWAHLSSTSKTSSHSPFSHGTIPFSSLLVFSDMMEDCSSGIAIIFAPFNQFLILLRRSYPPPY